MPSKQTSSSTRTLQTELVTPDAILRRVQASNPRASYPRQAALVVLAYESLLGRRIPPEHPEESPFGDTPIERWLRALLKVAGDEYVIARELLKRCIQQRQITNSAPRLEH